MCQICNYKMVKTIDRLLLARLPTDPDSGPLPPGLRHTGPANEP